MSTICQHVHRLELRIFYAVLRNYQLIKNKGRNLISVMSKIRNTQITAEWNYR